MPGKKQKVLKPKRNANGRIQLTSGGSQTTFTIRDEYLKIIRNSEYSSSKYVDLALGAYLKDQFRLQLTSTINQMYIDLMMLERLQEQKKMGLIKYTTAHGLQIEVYKDAIRMLENSPLFDPDINSVDS